jgi:hypothetical protein
LKKQLAIYSGLLGLGLLVVGFGAAPSAQAQPIYVRPDIGVPGLPPYQVISIVRSAGLAPLTRPLRRGPTYVLLATDRRGRDLRVVVDAYAGDIVSARPVYASRFQGGPYGPPSRMAPAEPVYGPGAHIAPPEPAYGPGARIAPALPDDDDGPRVIYGPRSNTEGNLAPPRNTPRTANTPPVAQPAPAPNTRTASAPPVAQPAPVTPLPRPRPSIAATQAPAEPAPAAQPAAPQSAPAAAPQAAPPAASETGPARPTMPQADPPKR